MKNINTMNNLVRTPAMVLFNNDTNEEMTILVGEELTIKLSDQFPELGTFQTGEVEQITKTGIMLNGQYYSHDIIEEINHCN
jgi:hypothetical protein